MSRETENFEPLRRLLKLKRYERPPLLYFDDFSSRVIARLELGERGEPDSPPVEQPLWQGRWLQRILSALAAKPAVIGVFSLAICASLIAGVFHAERSGVQLAGHAPDTPAPDCSADELARARAAIDPLPVKPAVLSTSSVEPMAAELVSEHW